MKPDVQIIDGQCFLRAENGEWRLAAIEAGDPPVVCELYAEADYSPKDSLPPIITKLVNEVVRLRGGAPTEEEVSAISGCCCCEWIGGNEVDDQKVAKKYLRRIGAIDPDD